ncbi:MAG: alpha/beta hydrolase [Deltaproteobacteria bacterium]|nr:alpha/beta hydrolase [Deltaproteobacteria bacterium]
MNQCSYAEIDGHKIAYHRTGKGEPMLLIHGMTTWSFIWDNLLPHLAENFDVTSIDLLGCGDSDKPEDADYSISAQAEIIGKVMGKLGFEKVHLVCHDIGGGIGQIFSVRYAKRLYDLVLINTVAYDFWPVQPIVSMRTPIIRQLAMALLDLGFFKLLVKRGVYHKERVTDEIMDLFYQPLRKERGKRAFLQLAKSLNNMQLLSISEGLKALQLPVLIIRGKTDIYLNAEISEKLKRAIKNSQLEIVETGGHFIQLDEPQLLVDLIKKFIYHKNAQIK